MKRARLTTLAALAGLGGLALAAGGAQALSLQSVQQPGASQLAQGEAALLQEAQVRRRLNRDRRWNRRMDGPRYRYRTGRYRHYRDGHYYRSPWWLAPAIIGGAIIGGAAARGGGYSDHVEWCSDRYRSYNPRDNTWVTLGGQVRQCNSPFD